MKHLKLYEQFENSNMYVVGLPSGEAILVGKVTMPELIEKGYIRWNNEIERFAFNDNVVDEIKSTINGGIRSIIKSHLSEFSDIVDELVNRLKNIKAYLKIKAVEGELSITSDRYDFIIKPHGSIKGLHNVKVYREHKQYQDYFLKKDQILDDISNSIKLYLNKIK